jgi:pimeloyl-ACP methyl ester carboxylesterase
MESHPAKVEIIADESELSFQFPTPRPGEIQENNIVYGRIYRCTETWKKRPAIVLMPGPPGSEYLFPFSIFARRCRRAGFNAVTLEPPYRLRRRPKRPGAQYARGYLGSMEAMAQMIAEVRALVGWLKDSGCPAVALHGESYGAWLAGLTASRDVRLNAVVLRVPKVYPKMPHERTIWRSVREMMQKQARFFDETSKTPLNLILTKPAIPKEDVLLIEAVHDLMVGAEPIEQLWQAWDKPEIWRLPHGHVSSLVAWGLTGRVLRWLSSRLNQPAAPKKSDDVAQQKLCSDSARSEKVRPRYLARQR